MENDVFAAMLRGSDPAFPVNATYQRSRLLPDGETETVTLTVKCPALENVLEAIAALSEYAALPSDVRPGATESESN